MAIDWTCAACHSAIGSSPFQQGHARIGQPSGIISRLARRRRLMIPGICVDQRQNVKYTVLFFASCMCPLNWCGAHDAGESGIGAGVRGGELTAVRAAAACCGRAGLRPPARRHRLTSRTRFVLLYRCMPCCALHLRLPGPFHSGSDFIWDHCRSGSVHCCRGEYPQGLMRSKGPVLLRNKSMC